MRCAALALGVLVCGIASQVAAQPSLSWQLRQDLNATLPAAVRVYEAENRAIPLRAWYVTIDTSAADLMLDAVLAPGAGAALTTIAEQTSALVAINSGYFGGGQSFSLVASGGVVQSPNIAALNRAAGRYYPTRGAFGQLADGTLDIAWIYQLNGTTYAYAVPNPNTQQAPAPVPTLATPATAMRWEVTAGVGGGPVLLADGEVRITWEEEVFFGSGIGGVNDLQPRSAIGYTAEGDVILMVVDGRQNQSQGVSLTDLALLMQSVGAVEALNLDGGGSSTLAVGTTLVNRPEGGTTQRSVLSAFVVRPRTDGSGMGDARTYDTGDACCYRETGSWFDSANAPFFGGTPARLHAVGAGEARASFTFPDAPPGQYGVEAWWVPASNRAPDTPYGIYRDGMRAEVRVDQSNLANAGQWVPLGTFDLAPGDSVVVTNDASGGAGTFVTVDALRLVPVLTTHRAVVEAGSAATIEVYPNPASKAVTVTRAPAATPEPLQVSLYDVLGRRVASQAWSAHQAVGQFDVARLSPGLYHLRMEAADGRVWHKRFTLAR